MKYTLLSLLLISTLSAFSQKYLDSKIIVTVEDTANIYHKVRVAFGKHDFQLKEDDNFSLISTFARDIKVKPGYMVARAQLSGNTVTFTARYGLLRIDDWGKTRENGEWRDLIYMKSSKIWKQLEQVAYELGGTITYSK